MKRIIILATALLLCVAGVSFAQSKKAPVNSTAQTSVEVLYFHGKQRCFNCMAIEKFTKEVIYKDFAAQVKSGQVRFKEIDITTAAGEKKADAYRVTWSSLFVNQWKSGKEQRNDMTRFGFKNAHSNPALFKAELKKKIALLLK